MIELLYQDAHLLICQKPAGLPTEGSGPDTLLARLAAQTGGRVYPVHRLDQPVGGLMVVARTPQAAAALCGDVARRAVQKSYYAVVGGVPAPASGQLRDLLYHDPRTNKTFVVSRQRRGVREAMLEYNTLATAPAAENTPAAPAANPGSGNSPVADTLTLVQVRLLTGRTHQIRAQFAGHGHPLAGDGRYGSRLKGPLALWSAELTLTHPATRQALHFSAEPPAVGFWAAFFPSAK